jgi:hypothetical protein
LITSRSLTKDLIKSIPLFANWDPATIESTLLPAARFWRYEPGEVIDYAEGLQLEAQESFYDLLYARASRLPRWMQVVGPLLKRVWPGVRWCYAILRLRLGPAAG